MKRSSPVTRFLVLSSFILSIGSFVAYRSGLFDTLIPDDVEETTDTNSSPPLAANSIRPAETDSPPPAQKRIMSSSKFIALPSEPAGGKKELSNVAVKDTTRRDSVTIRLDSATKAYMYSSKSGPIVDPARFERWLQKEIKRNRKNTKATQLKTIARDTIIK